MSERLSEIVDEREFELEVLNAKELVLVGFCADWSGCWHVMSPVVEAIAREFEGRMKVVLVDTDRAPGLKERYGVESIPALLFFRRGQLVEVVVGTIPRRALAAKAESLLEDRPAPET